MRPRKLRWMAVAALLAGGCGAHFPGLEVEVTLPPLPEAWSAAFGEIGFELRYTEPDGTGRVEQRSRWTEGQAGIAVRLPARAYAPLVVTPVVAALNVRLHPAGAIAPLDVGSGGRSLEVRWERGPAAALAERILMAAPTSAIPPDVLDVGELAEDIARVGGDDPWTVDADRLLASIVASAGEDWECRRRPTRDVKIPESELAAWAGVEWYVRDDALASPALLQHADSGEATLVIDGIATGFHRLFPVPGFGGPPGSWLDLGVTEQDAAWIVRVAPASHRATLWAP